MIVRLGHLCFRTKRFEDMTSFYLNILELPIKFSLRLPDGRIFGHYFSLGKTTFLEVFDHSGASEMWGGNADRLHVHPDSTYQHFCLQVTGLETLREGLIKKGCMVTKIVTGMDGSLQAWIKDPDGNDIELMEYTDASLQTASSSL